MNSYKKIAASAAVASLFVAGAVFADSINTDFESFTTGTVNGQYGWVSLGSAGSGCALYDHAVVSSNYGFSGLGNQVLRISNAVTSGCFGDQTFSKPLINEAGEADALNDGMSGGDRETHFEAQFDFASTLADQQPGLFVSVSPDRGDGARMSYLGFEDDVDGIDVIFYEVLGLGSSANFVAHQVANDLPRNVIHNAKFVIDFVDGPSNDEVTIYIDGFLVRTGTTWENYYRFDPESNPTLVSNSRTVDSLLFRTGGTAAAATAGKGFIFDNFMLSSGPVLVGPASKDQCMNDGWRTFNNPSFKNQGQCVAYVNHI